MTDCSRSCCSGRKTSAAMDNSFAYTYALFVLVLFEAKEMPATLVMEFGKCLQDVALGQCDVTEVKLGEGCC